MVVEPVDAAMKTYFIAAISIRYTPTDFTFSTCLKHHIPPVTYDNKRKPVWKTNTTVTCADDRCIEKPKVDRIETHWPIILILPAPNKVEGYKLPIPQQTLSIPASNEGVIIYALVGITYKHEGHFTAAIAIGPNLHRYDDLKGGSISREALSYSVQERQGNELLYFYTRTSGTKVRDCVLVYNSLTTV